MSNNNLTVKKNNNDMSQNVSFTYVLTGTGWAEAMIKIGDNEIKMDISYLCDPLTDFLMALYAINPVNLMKYSGAQRLLHSKFLVTWLGESLSHELCLHYDSDGVLDIVIKSFDADEKRPKKKIVFADTCSYYEFLKAVIDSLSALLSKHGIVGYADTWAGHEGFPFVEFIKLRHYLETGKLYKSRIVKLPGYKDACDTVHCSFLKKDISYLTQKK